MERNSRKLMKLLEADGWRIVSQRGSHVRFKHPSKRGHVIVPHPKHDLPLGTVRNIYKQAGFT